MGDADFTTKLTAAHDQIRESYLTDPQIPLYLKCVVVIKIKLAN